MTIKEALENICKEQIPREINGVNIEYYIREYRSVIGNKVVEVEITSTNVSPDNISVVQRYAYEWLTSHDFHDGLDLKYCRLKDEIRQLLCQYIRDIIEWTVTKDE